MNTLTVILGYTITLGLAEVVIFILAAVLLGFSIHFYWFGPRSVPGMQQVRSFDGSGISPDEQWRLQCYEQMEKHEKTQERLEKELMRMSEAEKSLLAELEEAREEVSRLEALAEKNAASAEISPSSTRNIADLVIAQQNLYEYLSTEMNERLEKAYQEFNYLEGRMNKLQSQVIEPQNRSLDHQEMEQNYYRISREYDELKLKHLTLMEDSQKLTRIIADTEEKLRDSNFQKQQLGKKVLFLEDMVKDLQEISGHHKKLEVQLRRITEIETLLTRSANEARKL